MAWTVRSINEAIRSSTDFLSPANHTSRGTPAGRIIRTSGSDLPRTDGSVVSLAAHSAAAPAARPNNSRSRNRCENHPVALPGGLAFEGAHHLRFETRPIVVRVKTEQSAISQPRIHTQASRVPSRAIPARVSCFIRSSSACSCRRPAAISRYACFSREVSSCSKGSIQ